MRLGRVRGGALVQAVEVTVAARLGDLALAEPDAHGGYWVVVRVWREHPAEDQYEVLDVRGTRVLSSFAVDSSGFAETPPMSRFRMGPDGALYQLTTSPDGLRIVRFDLGEES